MTGPERATRAARWRTSAGRGRAGLDAEPRRWRPACAPRPRAPRRREATGRSRWQRPPETPRTRASSSSRFARTWAAPSCSSSGSCRIWTIAGSRPRSSLGRSMAGRGPSRSPGRWCAGPRSPASRRSRRWSTSRPRSAICCAGGRRSIWCTRTARCRRRRSRSAGGCSGCPAWSPCSAPGRPATWPGSAGKPLGRIRSRMLFRLAWFAALSEDVRAELLERGVPSGRILSLPNGVDVKVYRPADRGGARAPPSATRAPRGRVRSGPSSGAFIRSRTSTRCSAPPRGCPADARRRRRRAGARAARGRGARLGLEEQGELPGRVVGGGRPAARLGRVPALDRTARECPTRCSRGWRAVCRAWRAVRSAARPSSWRRAAECCCPTATCRRLGRRRPAPRRRARPAGRRPVRRRLHSSPRSLSLEVGGGSARAGLRGDRRAVRELARFASAPSSTSSLASRRSPRPLW